jgi:hypothetical protein
MNAGYSGTPLAKKLGIKEGSRILLLDAPGDYAKLVEPLPDGVQFAGRPGPQVDVAHVFVTHRKALAKQLTGLRKTLRSEASVWISWPKKASKVPTDVTEDTIREVALPLGFVDIKVCAVSDVWSGLKLVVRKALR